MQHFDMTFYKGKKVLVTGHTGFKGSWMCRMLIHAGAEVTGYALNPPTTPSLFDMAGVKDNMRSITGDIRDLLKMLKVFDEVRPEIVIHMAAQPIVRTSYKDPVLTYETNVMGTVNVLECIRRTSSVRSFVNVTTDKVYRNHEWEWGYRETDELCGYDPYSNSKSCSELVTDSYRNSFFNDEDSCIISTCRAGNVVGGGDFAEDRIIPDCIRAAVKGRDIIIRNPHSTRPYQFVLEPVYAYLSLAAMQLDDRTLEGSYNIGPDDIDCLSTGELADLFCSKWSATHPAVNWKNEYDGGPHEANFLKLDTSKIRARLGWKPHYHMDRCMDAIIEFTDVWQNGDDVPACMDRQIEDFLRN